MPAASYTTDLTTLNILDSNSTPFSIGEPTGSTAGTTIATETDHFVVGSACVAKIVNATGISGLGFLATSPITIPADGAIYMWTNFLAANAISTEVNGGMQILVGNTLANYKRFYIYGSDTVEYGGWQCNAIDPAQTASATQGTPNGTWQYLGMACNVVAAVARGYPQSWDAVRYGRGSILITAGDLANGYATFDAAAEINDTNNPGVAENRWGIFAFANGTYTLQGRLALGQAGTAVDFRDSNRAIFIDSTAFVTSNFNTIEILNASSRVDWTGISISSLSTVSRGRVLVTDNATVNILSCTFTDMGTFSFLSNSVVQDSVFRRCGSITHGNSTFSNNRVTASTATSVLTANPANIQDCTFVSAGTGHAIEITTAGTYTFSGNLFSGYGATGTTNAAVYNNSGGSVTLNISGGGDVPTFRNGTGASTTIVAAANVTLTNLKTNSEVRVYLGTDPLTATELAGVENSGTTFNFSQSVAGQQGWFVVFHIDYQPIRQDITFSGDDVSIAIQQVIDRNYKNPP